MVTARDLVAAGDATLGETLSGEPGVTSTYFGPGASRPVIRGIGGDRVRILEAGIGTGDALSTSPDHAVSTESRGAERIEVIRGPATLLYGSSAVGGIVNVLDGRIARQPPTRPFSAWVEGLGGTVSDERTGSAGFTARSGPLVVHASGLWRDASDYAIPGFAEADHDEEGEEEGHAEEEVEGILENSALESRRGSAGATLVGDRGYLGVAFAAQRSDYGVPGHGHEEEGHSAEEEEHAEEQEGPVRIDLDQNRVDFEGALRSRGAVRNLKARFGVTDYTHVELEGDEVGTTFTNDYAEGRLESEHALGDRLQGAVGTQFASRDFEAVGEEAFVPPSRTSSFALFAYEELTAGPALRFQGGLRVERQTAESRTDGIDRADTGVWASLGFNWEASDRLSLAVSGSRSVKLPNAEELFSDGPHAATRAFEIGDATLDPETALGLDVTAHVHADRFRGSASFFATGFSRYIFEAATGAVEDGLDVFRYVQGDARFTGFEVEAEVDVVEGDASARRPHVSLEAMADFVSAELTAPGEHLPRIPPLRIGAGVNYRQGPFVVRGSARRTAEQDRVGSFEDRTPGFTMIDASVSYRVFSGSIFHDITLVGSNLTDTQARLHTSFLKELAPLPGREVRLVYRINF